MCLLTCCSFFKVQESATLVKDLGVSRAVRHMRKRPFAKALRIFTSFQSWGQTSALCYQLSFLFPGKFVSDGRNPDVCPAQEAQRRRSHRPSGPHAASPRPLARTTRTEPNDILVGGSPQGELPPPTSDVPYASSRLV